MDDVRFLADLQRAWDETARGRSTPPHDLDPEVAVLLRCLYALRDVPPPDPTFARQLRERLMHATTIPLPLTDARTTPGHNGRSVPPMSRAIVSPWPVSPGRWSPTPLATALLVLSV